MNTSYLTLKFIIIEEFLFLEKLVVQLFDLTGVLINIDLKLLLKDQELVSLLLEHCFSDGLLLLPVTTWEMVLIGDVEDLRRSFVVLEVLLEVELLSFGHLLGVFILLEVAPFRRINRKHWVFLHFLNLNIQISEHTFQRGNRLILDPVNFRFLP